MILQDDAAIIEDTSTPSDKNVRFQLLVIIVMDISTIFCLIFKIVLPKHVLLESLYWLEYFPRADN